MPIPLSTLVQRQLNRYTSSPVDPHAVSDLLATVAQELMADHPNAARQLMVEADAALSDISKNPPSIGGPSAVNGSAPSFNLLD